MRALVAFDKFKDALTARTACSVAASALHAAHPDWEIDVCPLTDGGEGFVEILTLAVGGNLRSLLVTGPRGGSVEAAFGLASLYRLPAGARAALALPAEIRPDAMIAIVEMATASGLALLPFDMRDPWQASSFGTGELIRAAAEAGAAAILLGVGGSATNDLGLGALAALGLRFTAKDGRNIAMPVPACWDEIAGIDGALVRSLPPLRIACDVVNPLLGDRGCAAVYGPQKGLCAADRPRLEHASARLGLMLCMKSGRPDELMDQPGAGAAGGIGFGLMAAADARILRGFDLVAAWLDLDARIAAADVVLTGEGRFDESSLSGKGPGAVVARAAGAGKSVHVFAGAFSPTTDAPAFHVHVITPSSQSLPEALRAAGANLAAAVAHEF